jgi:pimeloyl-ACP methyl ester carboxylesterase
MKHRNPEEFTLNLPQLMLRGLRWGTPDQPLIIALHGWLDNAASFSLLAPLLTDYQVVAFDFPGHGHSGDLAYSKEYSFVNFITIFTQAIEKLTLQPVIFMGHSLGGAILSFIAAEFPHFTDRLVLIDSMGLISDQCIGANSTLARWITNFYRVEGKPLKIYQDKETMVFSRAQVTDVAYDVMLPLAERGLIESSEGYRWRVDPRLSLKPFAEFTEPHALALLAALKIPTLEVEATHGVIFDNELLTHRLKVIEQLKIDTLEGPHHIHLAEPEKVAELINKFLKGTDL